ncbi:hypothetical protein XA68_12149 [Ophiocordyceps unilateralis]|uniref:MICOS complex subunit MIC12 n=1 Tax=Ophiocordyceps unilateralis TaxID=268505 RepID=A0A2A9PNT9_OPHUN|nr:hypothetical protein XA68_12149 [Ophiocordyceps unilateralis]
MGFVTGFTGGVALTLSLAYLSIAEQQRRREAQSRILRAQTWTLQTITSPDDNARQWQEPRSKTISLGQLAKDRWNHEIERAVRWAHNTDWAAIEDGLERRIAMLWAEHGKDRLAEGEVKAKEVLDRAKETGAQAAAKVDDGARRAAARAEDETRRAATRVQDEAKRAMANVQDEARRVEARAEDEARRAATRVQDEAKRAMTNAQDEARRVEAGAKDKAVEARGVLTAALDRVKSAVGWAGAGAEAAAAAVAAVAEEQTVPSNPVEKALRQRFEKNGAGMERAAEEVLRERYLPLGERDNTVLRGL